MAGTEVIPVSQDKADKACGKCPVRAVCNPKYDATQSTVNGNKAWSADCRLVPWVARVIFKISEALTE